MVRGRRRAAGWLLAAGLFITALGVDSASDGSKRIRVNQLGYRPGDPKVAFVDGSSRVSFTVRQTDTGQVAFEGTSGVARALDAASGDQVSALEFTPLRAEGEYVITTADGLSSPAFRITPSVYDAALGATLRSFTYQRCGAPITDGSPFARPVCHLADAREWGPTGAQRVVTGGWHDAGDYGKYVVSAGITLWHLGMIVSLPAPTIAPDLLREMRWELDWLLKMQREDGGVNHKVGPARWTGNHAPQDDREPRFVYPVSSAATADMAAATAQAARLFAPTDPAYAGRLRGAAEAAADWLAHHPTIVPPGGFKQLPGDDG